MARIFTVCRINHWLAFLLLNVCISVDGEQNNEPPHAQHQARGAVMVELSPSPPTVAVALNSSLEFKCEVNDTDYLIYWLVLLGTKTPPVNFTEEIGLYDNGSLSLLAVLTAYSELNGSIVSCGVQSQPEGELMHVMDTAIQIQDHLSSVGNLSCDSSKQRGLCSWLPPYNPSGVEISYYNISVVQNDSTVIREELVTNTSWTFCPSSDEEIAEYELIVTPVNSLYIVGDTDSTFGTLSQEDYSLELSSFEKLSPSRYGFALNFNEHLFACLESIEAWAANSFEAVHHNDKNIMVSSDNLKLEFDLPDDNKWILNIIINLKNSFHIPFQQAFSTYELQEFDMINPQVGQVCFQCHFIQNAMNDRGCAIVFEHYNTKSHCKIEIFRKETEKLIFDCINGVMDGLYDIFVYELQIISNEWQPVIAKYDASVMGIMASSEFFMNATYIPVPSSMETTVIDVTGAQLLDTMHLLLLIVGPVSVLIILIIFILIAIVFIRKKKNILKSFVKSSKASVSVTFLPVTKNDEKETEDAEKNAKSLSPAFSEDVSINTELKIATGNEQKQLDTEIHDGASCMTTEAVAATENIADTMKKKNLTRRVTFSVSAEIMNDNNEVQYSTSSGPSHMDSTSSGSSHTDSYCSSANSTPHMNFTTSTTKFKREPWCEVTILSYYDYQNIMQNNFMS